MAQARCSAVVLFSLSRSISMTCCSALILFSLSRSLSLCFSLVLVFSLSLSLSTCARGLLQGGVQGSGFYGLGLRV